MTFRKRTVLALICCCLWGSAAPVIKTGYSLLHLSSQDLGSILLFAGVRFLISGVLVLTFMSLKYRRWTALPKAMVTRAVKLGLVQTTLQYAAYFLGVSMISGLEIAILQNCSVFISYLLEKNTVSQVSVFSFATAFFNALFSCLLLHEWANINLCFIIALLCVCASIWLVSAQNTVGADHADT